ncbi:MAG: RND transporter [Betaproteobacteria bacterium SG8_41]|nr:MAG: RND transporter [Betaproteobacteria bacterium SG8_41]
MSRVSGKFTISLAVALLITGAVGWFLFEQLDQQDRTPVRGKRTVRAVPVEVAPVQRGPMKLERTFSGALEARAQFVVAPKVGGRVERIYVNLADTVERGQVVAELDNDEYVQAVAQARANLEVAEANVAGAKSALDIATRELERTRRLRERGIASESQFDAARANHLDKKSQLEVTKALVNRAQSALRSANIRLGYTKVTAGWGDATERRIVAERYVDEGETVAANAPLLRIVEIDPVTAVVFVTERDYALLSTHQPAVLSTDAFPGKRFEGRIERIAPIFREATRQARVELTVANRELLLKPGMFIRATVVLNRVEDATYVPEQALTLRNGESGVFVVNADGRSVTWRKVKTGIRDAGRVQVSGEGVSGKVVVLGQHLLKDKSAITIADEAAAASGAPRKRR